MRSSRARTKRELHRPVLVACALLLAANGLATQASAGDYSKDRVLAKFYDGAATRALTASALRSAGVRAVRSEPGGVSRVELSGDLSVRDTIKALEASGLVEYAEPDYRIRIGQTFPTDPNFATLWALHNTGIGGVADADIDAPEAWDLTTGDAGMVVAVIDSGVDYTHPDLAANMWVNAGEIANNGIDDDGNGYVDDVHGINAITGSGDPMDDHDHGTHVAGTIGAAANNGIGVVGVAWDVKILACKFLDANGDGFTSDATECVEYVTALRQSGVNVVLSNNSWGGTDSSQSLENAIIAGGNAGVLFVAAAGNNGDDTDAAPHFPSSFDANAVLSVASTTRSDQLSSFSNFGDTSVDLAAPGSSIYSTVPGGYATFSGTSMAAPHVAGAVALLHAWSPGASVSQLKSALMSAVDPLPALDGKVRTGGRLNIGNALLACASGTPSLSFNLKDGFTAFADEERTLAASLAECTTPILGATVTIDLTGGTQLALRDDGVAPDTDAEDGVYTAKWTPTQSGATTLDLDAAFSGGSLQRQITGTVESLPEYNVETGSFAWISPDSATPSGVVGDDQSVPVPIGFDFEFYGEPYSQVSVASNGYLAFGNDGVFYTNEPIADGAGLSNMLAVYWDDLNPSAGGSIRYQLNGVAPNRRFTVTWSDVPYWGDSSGLGLSFQASLFETNGRIELQYLDVNIGTTQDGGGSATVGIEHSSGQTGEQILYNQALLADGSKWVLRGPAQCEDTLDNDGDGLFDFPNDPDCSSATDDDESAVLDPGGSEEQPPQQSATRSSTLCGLVGLEMLLAPLTAHALRRRRRARP